MCTPLPTEIHAKILFFWNDFRIPRGLYGQQVNRYIKNHTIFQDRILLRFYIEHCLQWTSQEDFNLVNLELLNNRTALFLRSVRLNAKRFSKSLVRKCVRKLISGECDNARFILALALKSLDADHKWYADILPWITKFDDTILLSKIFNRAQSYVLHLESVTDIAIKSSICHDSVDAFRFLTDTHFFIEHVESCVMKKSHKIFLVLIESGIFNDSFDDIWLWSVVHSNQYVFDYLIDDGRLQRQGVRALNSLRSLEQVFDCEIHRNIAHRILHEYEKRASYNCTESHSFVDFVNNSLEYWSSTIIFCDEKQNIKCQLFGPRYRVMGGASGYCFG